MESLKPMMQNPEKHHMKTDMEHEVILDDKALQNESAEDDSPSEFEEQMVEASNALITGEEPAMHQLFYALSLHLRKKSCLA